MRTLDALASAALLIGSRRQAASLKSQEDEEKLWRYWRALSGFVHVTGQVYRFEDFLGGTVPPEQLQISARLSAHKATLAHSAVELLLRTLNEVPEPERKSVRVLISLLNFIAETGQLDDAAHFFIHQLEYAPVAIAHFTSLGEAEAWLKGVVEPPSPAHILIGDEY